MSPEKMLPGQMLPGQMLPGQMLPGQMSPWQLESVLDVPRNISLKFHPNQVNKSLDIPGMDRCCLDKCPRDSLNLL